VRSVKLLPLRVSVLGDAQFFYPGRSAAEIRSFDWAQTALFDPLPEMREGLFELLRSDQNPFPKHLVMLIAFAPTLKANRLQKSDIEKNLERTDAAVPLQSRLSRLHDALFEVAVRRTVHVR